MVRLVLGYGFNFGVDVWLAPSSDTFFSNQKTVTKYAIHCYSMEFSWLTSKSLFPISGLKKDIEKLRQRRQSSVD